MPSGRSARRSGPEIRHRTPPEPQPLQAPVHGVHAALGNMPAIRIARARPLPMLDDAWPTKHLAAAALVIGVAPTLLASPPLSYSTLRDSARVRRSHAALALRLLAPSAKRSVARLRAWRADGVPARRPPSIHAFGGWT